MKVEKKYLRNWKRNWITRLDIQTNWVEWENFETGDKIEIDHDYNIRIFSNDEEKADYEYEKNIIGKARNKKESMDLAYEYMRKNPFGLKK